MKLTKKKTTLLIFSVFIVVLIIDSFFIEPNIIEVNTLQIQDTGANMTIAFLADFQRRDKNPDFVQRVVSQVNEQNPDLVLLGGDYIEKNIEELPSILPLKEIKSRLGIYGIMGNHDYGAFGFVQNVGGDIHLAQNIIEFLESGISGNDGNIKILRNEKKILENKVTLIGLDDLWAQLRNEENAYAGKNSGYRILLSHNQDELEISNDIADLYLFGHTHCGQIRLPWFGSVPKLLGFSGKYDKGYYAVDGVDIYTTCGLAPWPRLFNPTEITIIKLLE